MRRVLLVISCIVFLLWGCAGQSGDQPSTTPGNEVSSTIQGYPAAQAPGTTESDSITSGYPAQASELPTPGSASPVPAMNDLIDKLESQAPSPKQGKGSIYGVLFSTTNQAPIPNTMVYLIETAGDGSEPLPDIIVGPSSDDIVLNSNQDGAILNDDIPPGNYYIVMSAPPYDWAEGYSDADAEQPLLIQVRENEKTNMGIIYIFWP